MATRAALEVSTKPKLRIENSMQQLSKAHLSGLVFLYFYIVKIKL
jgi:hypothetical protein